MGRKQGLNYSPAWRSGTKVGLPPLIRMMMERDWHGYEHFPREGGMIVAADHLSYADWAAMSLFVHEAGRYPVFWIKSSAFDVKLMGRSCASSASCRYDVGRPMGLSSASTQRKP